MTDVEVQGVIVSTFKGLGYSNAAIAGILGNCKHESNFVINRIQDSDSRSTGDYPNGFPAFVQQAKNSIGFTGKTSSFEKACEISDKTRALIRANGGTKNSTLAWGLFQWDPPTKLKEGGYGSVGGERNDVDVQCLLLDKGLNSEWNTYKSNYNNMTFDSFKAQTDPREAANAFGKIFERYAGGLQTSRGDDAITFFNQINEGGVYVNNVTTSNAKNYGERFGVDRSWYKPYYNYLKSAYRSGLPLQYGGVYISDIVEKLCILEGWTYSQSNVPTMFTPFTSMASDLQMNGTSALEYIVNVLAPMAVSSDGRYIGYVARLTNQNVLEFYPNYQKSAKYLDLWFGYNIPSSPVISFTMKSRGILLMKGIDASISSVTSNTNEASTVSTYAKTESFVEISYRSRTSKDDNYWFSKGLFSYYGYVNSLTGYEKFFDDMYNGSFKYGNATTYSAYSYTISADNLVSSVQFSTIDGDTSKGKLITDLSKFEKNVIEAECTVVGDSRIIPNAYILFVNMTKRGRHYTSGTYYIMSIADSFNKGSWTQQLKMYRFNENNSFFAKADESIVEQSETLSEDFMKDIVMHSNDKNYVDKKIQEYMKSSTNNSSASGYSGGGGSF